MGTNFKNNSKWKDLKIGITGANGGLGKCLTKELRTHGAFVIGLTHRKNSKKDSSIESPQEWISWSCGNEDSLKETLKDLDILILNHGINPKGLQNPKNINEALEINALSTWKIMQLFEKIALEGETINKEKELWINTSEAEIQIALSPLYEISKRLIGEIVSLRYNKLSKKKKKKLILKKLVLGPFKSNLNPLGIMSPEYVAKKIINKIDNEPFLVIVTPNPITHLLMPITESIRRLYYNITLNIYKNENN